ncbi:ABC transporter [Phytophthora megakarya]|uniref:ABC transporter n=1 Tax=Phytophthora megakarya TaxID=4795 RepID=A0A225WWY6_9STRA|nr:ABC transporter [Phytophthora megakarya]
MSDSEPERQVPSGSVWTCPSVEVEWHDNWDAFRTYIDDYQETTHQIFKQRTSTSVAKRNSEIQSQSKLPLSSLKSPGDTKSDADSSTGSVSLRLIPEEFKNFWIKLVCTHGWTRKSRGKGIRKSFFDKATGCKANIKAAIVWDADNSDLLVKE